MVDVNLLSAGWWVGRSVRLRTDRWSSAVWCWERALIARRTQLSHASSFTVSSASRTLQQQQQQQSWQW